MPSRKVLTVNQVVDIMLHYLRTRDWAEAFEAAIPQRKFKASKKARRRQAARDGATVDAGEDGEADESSIVAQDEF